ncbi:hypothetical protein ACJD0Z_08190 [Flavobacteriaceae bacterium M23B6Z8]
MADTDIKLLQTIQQMLKEQEERASDTSFSIPIKKGSFIIKNDADAGGGHTGTFIDSDGGAHTGGFGAIHTVSFEIAPKPDGSMDIDLHCENPAILLDSGYLSDLKSKVASFGTDIEINLSKKE